MGLGFRRGAGSCSSRNSSSCASFALELEGHGGVEVQVRAVVGEALDDGLGDDVRPGAGGPLHRPLALGVGQARLPKWQPDALALVAEPVAQLLGRHSGALGEHGDVLLRRVGAEPCAALGHPLAEAHHRGARQPAGAPVVRRQVRHQVVSREGDGGPARGEPGVLDVQHRVVDAPPAHAVLGRHGACATALGDPLVHNKRAAHARRDPRAGGPGRQRHGRVCAACGSRRVHVAVVVPVAAVPVPLRLQVVCRVLERVEAARSCSVHGRAAAACSRRCTCAGRRRRGAR
mmetsp:Transcript_3309/g.13631  ORF Transcript_3309/g.13631 Transcript_3309/m.13631 type:complete len:289 (-) Transcript_3309:1691-2557(-)